MELLEIDEVAARLGRPASIVRYYRDRFILYVPCVRVGRALRYPAEAIDLLTDIDLLLGRGLTAEEVESLLQHRYPVTVITARELAAPTAPDLVAADQRVSASLPAALQDRLDALATAEQVERTRSALIDLGAVLADRDDAMRDAMLTIAATLHAEVAALRSVVGDLARASLPSSPVSVNHLADHTLLPRLPRRLGHGPRLPAR